MALNPELASATEIARILRAPASIKIDTFSKGRVELHKMRIDPGSMLDGMKLSDLGRMQSGVLVCVVERGQHEVYIPDGSFTLLAGRPHQRGGKPEACHEVLPQDRCADEPRQARDAARAAGASPTTSRGRCWTSARA